MLVLSPTAVCPQHDADDPLCIPTSSANRFGNMPVGQTTPEMTFVLSSTMNPADVPDSGELRFKLEGDPDFAIVKNDCIAPLIPATGTPSTCTVAVTFKPSAAGLRKAVLKLRTSRGGSAQATLEGKGLN